MKLEQYEIDHFNLTSLGVYSSFEHIKNYFEPGQTIMLCYLIAVIMAFVYEEKVTNDILIPLKNSMIEELIIRLIKLDLVNEEVKKAILILNGEFDNETKSLSQKNIDQSVAFQTLLTYNLKNLNKGLSRKKIKK